MRAIGYVRQSRRADLDVALSPETQRDAIRRMAERDGITDLTIYEDLGRSGAAGKERFRTGYAAVVQALGTGVDVLYAINLTRVARSVPELYRLMQTAQEHRTRIVTAKEGTMDPTSPIGKAQFGMLTVFAEFERDLAVDRAHENVAARRANGDPMGRQSLADPSPIVAAFTEARSLNGAARLLNERGVPTWITLNSKRGRLTQWNGSAVRRIVARHAPAMLPRHAAVGVKPVSTRLFYRLLRCPWCGTTMTSTNDKGRVRYRCYRAETDSAHGRPFRVAEKDIIPWAMAEAARLRVPEPAYTMETTRQAERDALEARRVVIADMYEANGPTWRDEYRRRLAAVQEEADRLADLDAATALVDVPALDWSWPPEQVNAVLRALWRSVELDKDLRPVSADWIVPEWAA